MNKSKYFFSAQRAVCTLAVIALGMLIGPWEIAQTFAQSLIPEPTVLDINFDNCTATDVSQTANHGTLMNGDGDECIDSPIAGKAFEFDRVDEYVALTNKIQGYADFTISVWFRDDDLSYVTSPYEAHSTVIQTGLGFISLTPNILCGGQGEKGCITFAVFSNRDGRSVPNEQAYYGKVPDAFSVGEWHHVVLTADGSNQVKGYVDGEHTIDVPLAFVGIHPMSSYNFANLGAVEYTYYTGFYRAYYLNGATDEVKIYNTVLTADEIRDLYRAGLNTAPTANAGGPYLGAVNTDITFDGNGSSDPEGAPISETWTADGGTVSDNIFTAGNLPGIYDVCLTVNDGSLISEPDCTIVIIYDPEGGFVTGGGWIWSPEGAYTPDPSLTGKATFGFVSKYKKGATVPTGNTEFQFHVADLNFKSTAYDWLVIAGTKAQYKGTGTINGIGEYKFMLTAIDGSPDRFRIKIWDAQTEVVIYDNMLGMEDTADPATALQGGSIVVHKAK